MKGLVVITGGRSGIGAATGRAVAEAGMQPLLCDIIEFPPEATDVWPTPFDVSDENAVAREVAAIEKERGPIVGLVNAAGILGRMAPPHKFRMADWDREIAVDLRGTYIMCREVGWRMAQRGFGAIVNVASIVSLTSAPVHGYGPAKAAVVNLTMTLAAEWGARGVRVNAVSPGFTRTPALQRGLEAGVLQEDRLAGFSALRRLVEPEEVGHAIAWLLSDAASAITGVNLPVDAGFLCGVTWQAYGGLRSEA
ncbi:MAG: SDR family oxidoreductase [Acetobacteraceae bacterium]|nr:SDR family oxidoreductase [Acetobacteraceae bacterium]